MAWRVKSSHFDAFTNLELRLVCRGIIDLRAILSTNNGKLVVLELLRSDTFSNVVKAAYDLGVASSMVVMAIDI